MKAQCFQGEVDRCEGTMFSDHSRAAACRNSHPYLSITVVLNAQPFVVVYFGFHLVYPRGMSALSSMGWGTHPTEDEAFQSFKAALLLVPNRWLQPSVLHCSSWWA